jgi:hypothetical protein
MGVVWVFGRVMQGAGLVCREQGKGKSKARAADRRAKKTVSDGESSDSDDIDEQEAGVCARMGLLGFRGEGRGVSGER